MSIYYMLYLAFSATVAICSGLTFNWCIKRGSSAFDVLRGFRLPVGITSLFVTIFTALLSMHLFIKVVAMTSQG